MSVKHFDQLRITILILNYFIHYRCEWLSGKDNCMPTLIIIGKINKLLNMFKLFFFPNLFKITVHYTTYRFTIVICTLKKKKSKLHLHCCLRCYHFSHVYNIGFKTKKADKILWDFKICSELPYGTSHNVPGNIHLLSCATVMLSSTLKVLRTQEITSYAIKIFSAWKA